MTERPKRSLRTTIDNFLMARADAASSANGEEGPFSLGAKRSWVPIIGEIAWEVPTQDEARGYYAYICKVADRQIGYLRVPDYNYDEAAVGVFDGLVARFEGATAALVIDQVNNPGGSMHQMYALLSRLTDNPLALPRHQVTISDDAAAVAADVLANAADEPPERVAYSRLLLSEREAGRGTPLRLSHPLYLDGVERILPAAHHYTGNVVVLINELTFSAGEFLAAILQDNQRATLFGTRTAGAGGCAMKVTLPEATQFGIEEMTLTWTMARRTNGDPIENTGVRPDVQYEPTIEDLRSSDPLRSEVDRCAISGFQGYRRALLATMDAVASGSARRSAAPRTWKPTAAELKEVLACHSDWRESKAQKGQVADLSGAQLGATALSGLDLAFARLSCADLSSADLSHANLSFANLRAANLTAAKLVGANLSNAYLAGANFGRANLQDANLNDANLEGSDLGDADLAGANLLDAFLVGADLRGTDLSASSAHGHDGRAKA